MKEDHIQALNEIAAAVKKFMELNPPPGLKGRKVSLEKIPDDLRIKGEGITIEIVPKN